MRAHGFIRIVLTTALLIGLVGCTRSDDPFLITNELDVSISHWASASCRDDLYLIVEAEDGRRFVHEPPLCDDGHWVISE